MLRNCVFRPIPQLLLHVPQSPYLPHLQSTGHANELHSRVPVVAGQEEWLNTGRSAPTRRRCHDAVLVRVCSPVPQVPVQSVHFVQRDSLQAASQNEA